MVSSELGPGTTDTIIEGSIIFVDQKGFRNVGDTARKLEIRKWLNSFFGNSSIMAVLTSFGLVLLLGRLIIVGLKPLLFSVGRLLIELKDGVVTMKG